MHSTSEGARGFKVNIRLHQQLRRTAIAIALCVGALSAGHLLAAPAPEDSKRAKITELVQLQGLAGMIEQSKAAGREEARQIVRSMTDKMLAQFPNIPAEKRTAIEAASQRFLSDFDNGFDQDDAVRAWGRFYAEGLTEQELDAILSYYRSPAGQKDVRASQAALPQLQMYMTEKRTAAANSAVATYAAALREIVNPTKAEPIHPDAPATRSNASDPSVPDGKVVANSVSDHCEASPSATSPAHSASRAAAQCYVCASMRRER